MKPDAIVYTSNTGHTRQYALMLGEKTKLPVYALDAARTELPDGSGIVYLGWIKASHIKGYAQAMKHFVICAVCGIGLCDTGTLVPEVRKATGISEKVPLFTLQGGMDRNRLKGMDKLMISMLTKGLASQKQRSAQDERMYALLCRDDSYVCPENLAEVIRWYEANQT